MKTIYILLALLSLSSCAYMNSMADLNSNYTPAKYAVGQIGPQIVDASTMPVIANNQVAATSARRY